MIASSPLHQFLKWENEIPDAIFLRQPINGVWKTWSWASTGVESRKIANALHSMGIVAGSHIAILSKNCAHWIMADIAIMMAGCVSVPIYPSLSSDSIKPILEHSDATAIFVGKLDNFEEQKKGIPQNIITISIEAYGINEVITWENRVTTTTPLKKVFNWKQDDLFTIIYTSGTTGHPKGVMHVVSAVDVVVQIVIAAMKFKPHFDLFSYLPLSHIAERLAIEINGIYNGCTISFSESIASFSENLAATQPHCFVAVPHILTKFRQGILKKMPQKKLNLLLSIPLLNKVVKKGIRKKLGLQRASTIICGAAPISIEMLQWYKKLDIDILVVYGMTEDCVYNHLETKSNYRIGSVGKALPGLIAKIATNGEICVKSKGNMLGYYKEAQLTAKAFDESGYLKTGDMGEYDQDGFLFITGRIKDQFKTDKGKYVSPSPLEIELLHNADLEQVCVVGMGIPQPIALITLSETGKTKSQAEINTSLMTSIDALNPKLENFERISKAVVIKENWTIENGFMTPSLKVKRNQVEKVLLPFYHQWFHHAEKVLWH